MDENEAKKIYSKNFMDAKPADTSIIDRKITIVTFLGE